MGAEELTARIGGSEGGPYDVSVRANPFLESWFGLSELSAIFGKFRFERAVKNKAALRSHLDRHYPGTDWALVRGRKSICGNRIYTLEHIPEMDSEAYRNDHPPYYIRVRISPDPEASQGNAGFDHWEY